MEDIIKTQENQSRRDVLMASYIANVMHDATQNKALKFNDLIDKDWKAFSNERANTDIPDTRRNQLLAYTEESYIQGSETWNVMTNLFLADVKRVVELASSIIDHKQK